MKKNKVKKVLSLFLAIIIFIGSSATVFAESGNVNIKDIKVKRVYGAKAKINYLVENNIVKGYENGDLKLSEKTKRSEITKLIVLASGNDSDASRLQSKKSKYYDVNSDYWANGYINVGSEILSSANNIPMINGYPDGNFLPENNITYAELSKILVTLVKTDLTKEMHDNANKNWYSNWIKWAKDYDLYEDVEEKDFDKTVTREDAFVMFYNALLKIQEKEVGKTVETTKSKKKNSGRSSTGTETEENILDNMKKLELIVFEGNKESIKTQLNTLIRDKVNLINKDIEFTFTITNEKDFYKAGDKIDFTVNYKYKDEKKEVHGNIADVIKKKDLEEVVNELQKELLKVYEGSKEKVQSDIENLITEKLNELGRSDVEFSIELLDGKNEYNYPEDAYANFNIKFNDDDEKLEKNGWKAEILPIKCKQNIAKTYEELLKIEDFEFDLILNDYNIDTENETKAKAQIKKVAEEKALEEVNGKVDKILKEDVEYKSEIISYSATSKNSTMIVKVTISCGDYSETEDIKVKANYKQKKGNATIDITVNDWVVNEQDIDL